LDRRVLTRILFNFFSSTHRFRPFDFTAAARALMDLPDLSARDVAQKAMSVAAEMCVYTNDKFLTETLKAVEKKEE